MRNSGTQEFGGHGAWLPASLGSQPRLRASVPPWWGIQSSTESRPTHNLPRSRGGPLRNSGTQELGSEVSGFPAFLIQTPSLGASVAKIAGLDRVSPHRGRV